MKYLTLLLLATYFTALFGVDKALAADTTDIAKASQNPVADLISLPIQNNFNFGVGPSNATQWIANIQPVVPINLSEDWNIINRAILPVITQDSVAPGIGSKFGLGDLNYTAFVSPDKPGLFTWGVGPVITLPTATDDVLGTGK